jgi:hypothetical protein
MRQQLSSLSIRDGDEAGLREGEDKNNKLKQGNGGPSTHRSSQTNRNQTKADNRQQRAESDLPCAVITQVLANSEASPRCQGNFVVF